MSSRFIDRIPFAKIVIFFAVAFGIGVGLCGLDYFLAAHNIGRSREEFGVGPLDGPSILVMLISALGLIVSLLAWIIVAILRDHRALQTALKSSDDSPKSYDPR